MKAPVLAAATIAAAIVFLAASTPLPSRLLQRAGQMGRRDTSAFRVAERLVPGTFNGRVFRENGVELRYQLFLPRDYDRSRRWPVIVALHGSAEKGSDGVRQLGVGVGKVVRARAATFPAVVLLPQVPSDGKVTEWTPALTRMADSVMREVNGDPDRLYLSGLSMGGILAYDMVYHHPGKFAALVTISAHVVIQPTADRASRFPIVQAHPAEARALGRTPVWIFQGAHDDAALAPETRDLVATLKASGVPVTYTEYADDGHAIWDRAYQTPGLWEWLFAQHR